MHNFKKALVSSVAFLLCVALLSGTMICAYLHGGTYWFEDAGLRQELAGQIDVFYCGASHGQSAFIPSIYDSITGAYSYNLCSAMLPLHGRKVLIEKEYARNPVKTVFLEISFDALHRDQTEEAASMEGETYLLSRLDSFSERVSYALEYIPSKNYDYCYSMMSLFGVASLKSLLSRRPPALVPENRGYHECIGKDKTLPESAAAESYESMDVGLPLEANMEEAQEIVDFCKQHDIELIVTVTPLSDTLLWEYYGEETSYQSLRDFCEKNACLLLDFNLYRQRYSLFKDESSYESLSHLCDEGAEVYTNLLASVYTKYKNGEEIDELFYPNYEEMELDSPYRKYLQ